MKLLILSTLLLASTYAFAYDEPKAILVKTASTLEKHKSISYTAAIKMKFFDHDDTAKYTGKVFLARAKDSVFGGKIWYATSNEFYKLYDLNKVYIVSNKEKKVRTFDAHNGEEWGMSGNTAHDVVWTEYLEPEKIRERVKNAVALKIIGDTTFNGKDCYKIYMRQPDDGDFTDWDRYYFIGKKDNIPYFTCASVKYQGNYQYREFILQSYTFDKVPSSQFSAKQIPSDYTIEAYERKEEDYTPLDSGAVAPIITGKHYQHNLKEETLDYKGKITVLDFWYMACHPCVLAIPEMEKVREKYKDDPRVQVIGVNSSDADTNRIKKLPQFLEHNPIGYSFFLVDRQVPKDFKVMAWPTFYIIGTDGKVAYSDIGFDADNFYTNLSEKIDELLK